MLEQSENDRDESRPKWQPLPARERRVAGVLIEKAKTTPAAYPLTLNAIKTGCNQKSNRHPVMQLEEDDISEALENLRELGAVTEILGGGRVSKFRHLLYEWLGVDKVELAVMAELLLRGAQTVGELRGRSARMEPIADVAALRPILESLKEKGLITFLTPEGRGCVATHMLFRPQEMEKVRAQYAHGAGQDESAAVHVDPPRPAVPAGAGSPEHHAPVAADTSATDALRRELQSLRADTDELRSELSRLMDDIRRDLDDVKQQLGI